MPPFGLPAFTLLHVLLSVVGIVSGLVVVGGLMSGRRLDGSTAAFLVTTVLTNVTGFFFPFTVFLPSHGVGILSLLILPAVIAAVYWKQLVGRWRAVFVAGSVTTLYFNVFVLMTQLFRKVPAMLVLAPRQNELPFLLTHLLVLVLFVWLGRAAWKGFVTPRVADGGDVLAAGRAAAAH